jgi:hypothetical protein
MQLFIRSSSGTQVLPVAGGVLGRADDAAVRLYDESVSSHHAEFSWDGQKWWIRPLADHNPVYRDGKRLPVAKVPLGDSGTLQFGKLVVTFWTAGHEPRTDATAPAEWQRLRLREVPADLVHSKPPLVEMDLSRAPTLALDRNALDRNAPLASTMPPTLMSTPEQEAQPPYAQPQYVPPQYLQPMYAQPLLSTRSPLPLTIAGTVSPVPTMPVPEPTPQGLPAPPEPLPTVSERAEFFKQASVVVALLTVLSLLGFGIGYWLLA